MDFVVYGTGYGATLMLLGYALRTWGPKWRLADRNEDAYDRQDFRSAQSAWTRFAEGLGAVIATCGAVLVLFTFLLMFLNPGDSVGVMVCLIVSAAALVGVAGWAWVYFDRYGSWGVLRMPEPLTSYEPLRYHPDIRPMAEATAPTSVAHADGESGVDEAPGDGEHGAEDEVPDELEARVAKFATHHPDGEMEVRTYRDRDVTATEPEDEATPATKEATDAEIVVEAGADAAESPAGDAADVEPAGDEAGESADGAGTTDVEPTETPEPVLAEDPVIEESAPVTGGQEHEAASDDEGQPALEVVPEAHEPVSPEESVVADAVGQSDERSAGGREEALRRLRERRSQRDTSRPGEPDDA